HYPTNHVPPHLHPRRSSDLPHRVGGADAKPGERARPPRHGDGFETVARDELRRLAGEVEVASGLAHHLAEWLQLGRQQRESGREDRKRKRLNSSHRTNKYAV